MIYISFDIGVKNLALCILKYEETITILDWKIITLAETKKEAKDINDLSEIIYMEMDAIVGNLKDAGYDTIDFVLIENQPSNLNGVMKTVQHIIYSYYNLLKYWDGLVKKVVLVNASLKLKNHTYQLTTIVKKEDSKKNFRRDKYKNNKLNSIEICREYIKNDAFLTELFNSNKKKDDLSDSCLQTVSYIRNDIKGDKLAKLEDIRLDIKNFVS
jgi:hypothetical protein